MRLNSRVVFALLLVVLTLAKVWLAWRLPLFGDEAFYWLESRSPGFAHTDVPGLTPWLIALGTQLPVPQTLATRLGFLILGLMLPFLVFAWSRRFVGDGESRAAAILSMLVPLAASMGLLALPDVPLTVVILLLALMLDNVVRTGRWRDYLWLGALIAAGWLAHYRFAVACFMGLVFLIAAPRGRALWRGPRLYAAFGIGLLGLVPTLIFNLRHEWAGFRFQFVDRHPWSFQWGALAEPVVQWGVTTPMLWIVAVTAMVVAWRRRDQHDAPHDILALIGGGMLVFYLLVGLFTDNTRLHLHWPLPAYLLALPLVPGILRDWRERHGGASALIRRWIARLTVPVALAGVGLTGAVLFNASLPASIDRPPLGRPIPDNLQGWREFYRWSARLAATHPKATLIADNFMPAAQWSFRLRDARPVYVLDHPMNRKHGRQGELEVLRRDEAALRALAWTSGVLIVEVSAVDAREQPDLIRGLCDRFGELRAIDDLNLFAGRWRFVAFEVKPPVAGQRATPCQLPAFAYIDTPAIDVTVPPGPFDVTGWAFRDGDGLAKVEIVLDGDAITLAEHGLPAPQVLAQWPDSTDPAQPNVGFAATVDAMRLSKGWHELAIAVVGHDGRREVLARQRVRIGAGD